MTQYKLFMQSMSMAIMAWMLTSITQAQTGSKLHCESIYQIRNSTTLVVLDDSATSYNTVIKATIEQNWYISPIEYISRSELSDYLGNRAYTMLLKNGETRVERRAAGSSQIQFNEIAIYPCNRGNALNNYHARDAYAKIRVWDVHQPSSYLYKLPILLKAMHRYLVYADSGSLVKNNYDKQLPKWLNDSSELLQDMTLYLAKEEMPEQLNTEDEIIRYYDHAIQIAPQDSIPMLMKRDSTPNALLHLLPNISQIYVITASGQILYAQSPDTYKKFGRSDLVNISQAADGKKNRKGLWNWLNNN